MKFQHLFRGWKDVGEYAAGDVIFAEGEPADVMYVVLSGEVELTLRGEPLAVDAEGGMLGETALLGSESRSGAATARTDVKLARISREQLKELMRSNPDFALHVMAGLANRLRAVDTYISKHLGRKSGRKT
jgi:CRP/FNR family cyclic AMP-dependent transcriptional regulator